MVKQKTLLFLVTEDWYFCSHRLALAKAAQQTGWDVSVLTRVNKHADVIRSSGCNLFSLDMVRGGLNPFLEFKTLTQIWRSYRQLKSDLVHHIALKPILYGGVVAVFLPKLKVVNLLAGLGSVFSAQTYTAVILRPVVKCLIKRLLRREKTITVVQNQEDYDFLRFEIKVPEAKLRLIKGSGVDIERFCPAKNHHSTVRVALVSRLLWEKGVGEFVEAVKFLKQKGLRFDAFLVGDLDKENMRSVSLRQLELWCQQGQIEWLGAIEEVAKFWQNTDIAVLPSYREGLPKSLLEAAACGLPIVTTDTSGCREIVQDGVNGFLVPVRSIDELQHAMETLILNPELRQTMGQLGREKVEREFSEALIVSQTLAVYEEML